MMTNEITVFGYMSSDNTIILATINGVEMIVANDPENAFRALIAEWEAAGNVIPAYEPPIPTIDVYRAAIQMVVDQTAQSRRYDSGNSLASYAVSTNQAWSAEAQAFVAWRDQVWAYAYEQLDRVQNGELDQPTVEEFLAELPVIEWPAPLADTDT